MICPKCQVQAIQFDKRGGGNSREGFYETWMVLECPSCGTGYKEYYSCQEVLLKKVSEHEKINENRNV